MKINISIRSGRKVNLLRNDLMKFVKPSETTEFQNISYWEEDSCGSSGEKNDSL